MSIRERPQAPVASERGGALELGLRRLEAEHRLYPDEFAAALLTTLVPPRLPRVPGLDLAALYRPANHSQVGGDFYDIFPLGKSVWGVAIGDVCGKGARAAAIAAATRHALRGAAVDRPDPCDVLAVVNEALLMDNDGDEGTDLRFCTVAYARLNAQRTGFTLSAASAGHPVPLVLRSSGILEDLGVSGTLLGCLAQAPCTARRVFLQPGDTAVFFTDGLIEAPVPGGLFGSEGLTRALQSLRGASAAELIAGVDDALTAASDYQRDDVAMVALRVL